jgi:uncharacterized membrane protein YgaE (UPF0421/DUF939 family)
MRNYNNSQRVVAGASGRYTEEMAVDVLHRSRHRLHGRLLPIVQTAVAAVVAWLLAGVLVEESRPAFAAIAAVISVGATSGQRGQRAVHLTFGVVLGITAAHLLITMVGVGAPQLGLLVVLAMIVAVLLGGSELVVVEAAVSAILLVTVDPGGGGDLIVNRVLEAIIGGATALAVSALLFPPDPALAAGRAGQELFSALGRTLEQVASGLESRDPGAAQDALDEARGIDPLIAEVHESLAAGREASLLGPRRGTRSQLGRYDRSLGQVDLAVRSTRVLARNAHRLVRAGNVPQDMPAPVRLLSDAVWELAAAYDDPRRARDARRMAVAAAAGAIELNEEASGPAVTELVGQVRSTAVDVMRAADRVADRPVMSLDAPTEELLAVS